MEHTALTKCNGTKAYTEAASTKFMDSTLDGEYNIYYTTYATFTNFYKRKN